MTQKSTSDLAIRRVTNFPISRVFGERGDRVLNANAGGIGRNVVLGIMLGALIQSACTRAATTAHSTDKISQNHDASATTLVMALSAGPSTLDPRTASDATSTRLTGLMFSSLVRIGPRLEAVGDAAESWTFKNREYVFRLKPGLSFSNGRPMNEDDLTFSFHEFMKPTGVNSGSFTTIDRLECHYGGNDRSVKIHVRESSASLLNDLSKIKFLPHPEVLALGPEFATHPVGSGPFVFESQTSNEIVLRGRMDHPYAAPKMPLVVFKIVRDDNTRLFKLLRGEIDIAQQELPPAKIAMLESVPTLEVIKRPGLSVSYLIFNLRDPVLQNADFRRAVDLAIDRESIVRYKQLGLATPASSLLSPVNRFHDDSLLPTTHDAVGAVALFSRLAQTLPLRVPLTLKTSNNPAATENGRVIANQINAALATVGGHVRTQSFEWGTYYGDIQRGNFQLAIMRWTGTIDPNLYRQCFLSTELPPHGKNRGHYKNLKMDALLDQGLTTEDFAKRKVIYDQVQRMIAEDRPILPLWYEYEVTVLNRRVKNYELTEYADYYPLTQVSK